MWTWLLGWRYMACTGVLGLWDGYTIWYTVMLTLEYRWGRKPIMLGAIALFIASSIVCALAVDMKMLIVGRAVQGCAGGGLIMMVNIVISDIFSMRYVY
jgi:predicted MFS family arabinose efflux permease